MPGSEPSPDARSRERNSAQRSHRPPSPAAGSQESDPGRTWRPVELIRWTADYLTGRGFEEGRLTAELLLADVLQCERLDLYLQFERPLSPSELTGFREHLRRRLRHEPIQYILGTAHFRELVLTVDARVLIPRPETELLVGEILARAAARPGLDLLEIGTGSGAIALSLHQEGAFRRIVATDISVEALALAQENAAGITGTALLEFRTGPFFDPVAGERFDFIVSNPPYISEQEREILAPEVVGWEPALALFAGDDGLEVVRRLIAEAPRYLRSGGLLALEIGAGQGPAVAELVRSNPSYEDPAILPDLSGRERMLLARCREIEEEI